MRKLCTLLLIIVAVNISAQTFAPDTTNASERIHTIQSMLDRSKKGVNVWWYGWLGAYSAATVAQGVICITSDKVSARQDMALGAGTTFLGAVFQLMTPINTGKDADSLAKMPENTPDDRWLKLKVAEDFLKSNAAKEQEGRSWKIHALNTAVNLGSGIITWLGYKRSVWDGVENFLLNSAITETQIWTQPIRTFRDYNYYRRKYIDKKITTSLVRPEYYLRTYPCGVSLAVVF